MTLRLISWGLFFIWFWGFPLRRPAEGAGYAVLRRLGPSSCCSMISGARPSAAPPTIPNPKRAEMLFTIVFDCLLAVLLDIGTSNSNP